MRSSSSRALPGPLVAGPAPRPVVSRRRRTWLRRAAYGAAAPVLYGILRGLARTCRPAEGAAAFSSLRALLAEPRPAVLVFWHHQIVPVLARVVPEFRRAGRRLAFLVSPSVDGDLVSLVLKRAGALVARGSATRTGVLGLYRLYRLLREEGAWPVVVPDGPQGPPEVLKLGAQLLARVAGVPILPLAAVPSAAWRLPTWDRLLLPRPGARVAVCIGELLPPPRGVTPTELERERRRLEDLLRELTRAAAVQAGRRRPEGRL